LGHYTPKLHLLWNIVPHFDYSSLLRRMIYTNNAIESYHRSIREMTKTKGAFTSDNTLLKLASFTIQNMDKIGVEPLLIGNLFCQN
jgi:transposase-like protein